MTIDWEEKWCTGDILWDEGECSPALVELVENEKTKSLLPTSGCGLVPGCGSGYDVKFLATPSLHMFGLDMSKTCIELCNKKHPNAAELNYEFIQGDFFNFKVPEGGFDLAYDYSFFAALPPYMRNDWANQFSRIIKSDGILICLMYPLEEREIGPPYSVSVESYTEFLSPSFDLIFIKDAIGYECRLGKEKISVWKRK